MNRLISKFDENNGYNNENRGNRPGGNGGNNGNEPPKKPNLTMILLAFLVISFVALLGIRFLFGNNVEGEEVPYSTFLQYVEEDKVEKVSYESSNAIISFTLKAEEKEQNENTLPDFSTL